MLRWLMLFGAVLVLSGLVYPSLRTLGLAELPGDLTVHLQGQRLFLPFTTSLLVSTALAAAWRLLSRP